jgi:protein-ribulosamine 3-kinase
MPGGARADPLDGALTAALRERLGAGLTLIAARPIGGGSVAQALRLHTSAGPLFVKLGPPDHPFDAEAAGLEAIAATGTLRAPRVIAHGTAARRGFLVLEWIDLHDEGDWRAAGSRLAALHATGAPRFGWHRDNTIGTTPQRDRWCDDWAGFWREQRLRPQFALARRRGLHALADLQEVACAASDALLAGHAPAPSLLHGDLWRGNLAFDAGGQPVVFDPACFFGDAEAELAICRLFGGFAPAFFDAYHAARPPRPGHARREPLYRLYHVLNHANLFGAGYVREALALIRRL